MARVAWTLYDSVEDETYSFDVNPSEGGTPDYAKNLTKTATIAPDGNIVLFEGARPAQTLEVSGIILEEDQFDTFVDWESRRRVLLLTDDLGRSFNVLIERFSATRQRRRNREWYHSYNMTFAVVS